MKLIILVPSKKYLDYAGARIRYGRVAPFLEALGMSVEAIEIGHFDLAADYDALLISKCHDPRSLVAAAAAMGRGKVVGIDLFDDYFSDRSDSRLIRYRNWLIQIIGMCNFALCSTEAMAKVLRSYRPDLPVHILNDPAPEHDTEGLGAILQRKAVRAIEDRCIRAAWYGVGDNAFFTAGLGDLAAHGEDLAALSARGFSVELTVLTNRRALSANGLALINRLPVPTRVAEWSEVEEQALLEDSLLALLPVNASSFSTAKSLNRALTALAAGCQILSTGFPLYRQLKPLLYEKPSPLLDDLEAGELRFSVRRLEEYRRLIKCIGDAEVEADRLHSFLMTRTGEASRRDDIVALIHGRSVNLEAHTMVGAIGGLSVASPFAKAPIPFDVIFKSGGRGLTMLVSRGAARRLLPGAALRLRGKQQIRSVPYLILQASGDQAEARASDGKWVAPPLSMQLATYGTTMAEVQRQLASAFGPCQSLLLESSQIPFPLISPA